MQALQNRASGGKIEQFGLPATAQIQWPAMIRTLLIVSLSIFTFEPSGASADIYQCKNPDGSLHFTNTKRPKRSCKRVVREKKKSKRTTKTTTSKKTRDPGRYAAYDPIIEKAARLYNLPESFIRAVMRVESDFNPKVVSHAGAMGLMQLMPRTAKSMGVRDAFDPHQNILGGSRYLRMLANRFEGDMILTIAGYNAGEGAVQKYGGIPPYKETQRYVRRVLKHYHAYRDANRL